MSNVAQSFEEATASSRFTVPNYWRDPNSGNAFQIQVEYPPYQMQSLAQFRSIPVIKAGQSQPYLGDIATVTTPKTRTMPVELDVSNPQRLLAPDMYPSVLWPIERSRASLLVPASSIVTTTESLYHWQ